MWAWWAMALWLEGDTHAAGDTDISCRYLIGGLVTGLAICNGFWALWVKALLKEAKDEAAARVEDLKEQAKSVRRGTHHGREESSSDNVR